MYLFIFLLILSLLIMYILYEIKLLKTKEFYTKKYRKSIPLENVHDVNLFFILLSFYNGLDYELWNELLTVSGSNQDLDDFINSGKMCYRIRGHVLSAIKDLSKTDKIYFNPHI